MMRKLGLFLCLGILSLAVAYAQAPRKYALPEPVKEEAKGSGWGSLLKAASSVAKSVIGVVEESVSLQEVSNSLYNFENNVGGSWMKDARSLLGKTKDAVQLYMVNVDGAYLYDPATRSLNLVAEGDFREQIEEQDPKYKGAKVFVFAGQTLEAFAKQQAGGLLGEKKTSDSQPAGEGDEEAAYPTSFSPGKVFVILGAKNYLFH